MLRFRPYKVAKSNGGVVECVIYPTDLLDLDVEVRCYDCRLTSQGIRGGMYPRFSLQKAALQEGRPSLYSGHEPFYTLRLWLCAIG